MRALQVPIYLLVLGLPLQARAQASARSSQTTVSVASLIARSLRTDGNDSRALPLLTQARQSERDVLLDEIADTLAAIAIERSVEDVAHARARAVAIGTLHLAGMGQHGLPGKTRGTPYAGAATRLRRIVELSYYVDARAGALKRLNSLDRSAAFPEYLRQKALLPTIVAATAVELLADERGEEGREIARELYRSKALKNNSAIRVLEARAHARGW